MVRNGQHTGRSHKDKFIVSSTDNEAHVWWGPHKQRIGAEQFEALLERMQAYLTDKDLFVQDVYAGADAA